MRSAVQTIFSTRRKFNDKGDSVFIYLLLVFKSTDNTGLIHFYFTESFNIKILLGHNSK